MLPPQAAVPCLIDADLSGLSDVHAGGLLPCGTGSCPLASCWGGSFPSASCCASALHGERQRALRSCAGGQGWQAMPEDQLQVITLGL